MSLDLICPNCQRFFRPVADPAGEHVLCPECSQQAETPADEAHVPNNVEKGIDPRWKTSSTIWTVQAEDGNQYGPVTGDLLLAWYREGRITADCQLLRKGAGQWQWATDLFPDLEPLAESELAGPAEAKLARARTTPTQSATRITPLSPGDFPTTGAGLKSLGPVIRQLPPGYGEPRLPSQEALEDRRKFAPYMVAQRDRRPLHKMLVIVAIANFIVGTLRAGLYFVLFLNLLGSMGSLGEDPNQQLMARAAASLVISILMLVLNITLVSAGIGLLQQRDWGRTATYIGTLIGMVIQLTGICVTMMLGAEGSGLDRVVWISLLILLMPSILYDAFAAAALSVPSVVENLEE